MKIFAFGLLTAVLLAPLCVLAEQATPQPNDIQIELAKENKFVVKMMDVFDKSGKKIPGLIKLDAFDRGEKIFAFKNSKNKNRKVSDREIKEIVFTRLRQGILTGKPPSLRVIAWNGKIKNFEIGYRDVKIKGGYLYLDQYEASKHFDDSNTLRASSNEWSAKFQNFWQRTQKESPDIFSTHFDFKGGYGIISREMAAAYCKTCVKIEILSMQIDSDKETIRLQCKIVFYDRYNEK